MGYEVRMYLVSGGHNGTAGEKRRWADDIVMVDLCKVDQKLYHYIRDLPDSECYIYADDGNTRITEDRYGRPLKMEVNLEKLRDILTSLGKYRRYKLAKEAVKCVMRDWESDEKPCALFFGY